MNRWSRRLRVACPGGLRRGAAVPGERGQRVPMGGAGTLLWQCYAEAATWRLAASADPGACAFDPRHGADHPGHNAGRVSREARAAGDWPSTAGQLAGKQVFHTACESAYRAACQHIDQMMRRPKLPASLPICRPMVERFGEPYTSKLKARRERPTIWAAACRRTTRKLTRQLTARLTEGPPVWFSYLLPNRPARRLSDRRSCWLGQNPVDVPTARLADLLV